MNKQRKENQWKPIAGFELAKTRAIELEKIRNFFKKENVLEVDTPILSKSATSDINIESISALISDNSSPSNFLHTSPEFYMKRLLADGFKDIYQICKVFRDSELGLNHLPEFTMIEWYRMGFNLKEIIRNTVELISMVLSSSHPSIQTDTISYQDAFKRYLNIDPINDDIDKINNNINIEKSLVKRLNKNQYLDFLLNTKVTKEFHTQKLTVLHHYPSSQSALARICPDNEQFSDRFEVFFGELELANGYVELTDVNEIKQRFSNDQLYRRENGLNIRPLDYNFIDAMDHGFPECAGVALGFDRLLMISEGKSNIEKVQQFSPFTNN